MEYLVFPFGKYKGEKLTDLPSTYIVMALEKFDLPEELFTELGRILLGRLGVYSSMYSKSTEYTKADFKIWLNERKEKYEKVN